MFGRVLLAAVLGLAPVLAAQAWWNDQWSHRKAIKLDTSAQGGAIEVPLADVPVLVRLHSGNFKYFLDIADGGQDLRFLSADDRQPLKFHVERMDQINEIGLVWFRQPALTPNAATDQAWMYFGNQAPTPGQDAPGTYDGAQALVYHFADDIAQTRDVTANGNHPDAISAQPASGSLIAAGAKFAGGQSIKLPDSPSLGLNAATGWTFSAWIKADAPQPQPAYVYDRVDGDKRLSVVIEGSNIYASYAGGADGAPVRTDPARATLSPGWHHLALTAAAGRLTLYLDGVEVAAVDAALANLAGPAVIGASVADDGFLSAELDEVGIANTARPAAWFKFAVASQGTGAKLVVDGGDEGRDGEGGSAEGGGYFGIIVQQVFGNEEAIVEQSVIGICGVMAAIAVLVMFFKAVFLTRARSATRKFLHAYDALGIGADARLDALFESRAYRDSPLFRVYQQGIEEVKRRHAPSAGAAGAGLEEKALASVRAALDATMVRETQRMNSQMVLLTIAISGGPFIGLLGTVVGVMVTFAAIAATGDVNITAIAPGMAAALLATVAGLGVAIPSLFGYNYLGSRIKELNADMHVYADELIARINENYGA
ncbi:MAG: DUF2341 domain-containing protein [Gammaproteobacteria bacterium]